MYQVGDMVVYKKDVCEIMERKEKYFKNQDYLLLVPKKDASLKIVIPELSSQDSLRNLISEKEVEEIIKMIPSVKVLEAEDKELEREYKRLLSTGNPSDLIRIIKTASGRNQIRIENKKKIGDIDNFYFTEAEKHLYLEIGTVLNMDFDETKDYILTRVEGL